MDIRPSVRLARLGRQGDAVSHGLRPPPTLDDAFGGEGPMLCLLWTPRRSRLLNAHAYARRKDDDGTTLFFLLCHNDWTKRMNKRRWWVLYTRASTGLVTECSLMADVSRVVWQAVDGGATATLTNPNICDRSVHNSGAHSTSVQALGRLPSSLLRSTWWIE
jgi:hypothetical protein